MPKRRENQRRFTKPKPAVGLKELSDGNWEFVHPKCAEERADDIEDVEQMLAMGEFDVARDELRWLLSECSEFITAHKMLGEIAMGDEDLKLARAHFGYAYHAGNLALEHASVAAGLLYDLPANRDFLEAAKGLAWSLQQLNKVDEALRIAEQLVQLDPSDPLDVKSWITDWKA
ncbi:MAG: hypothetical protein MPJ50_19190 [Pirellulales bacterium]|nr:hypothetical protein [Pirellulales bacterium]